MKYSPHQFGIDHGSLQQFRTVQDEALEFVFGNPKVPFFTLAPPTGSGKSAIAMALARQEVMNNGIAAILTGTKALQGQYQMDWGVIHEEKNNAALMGLPMYDARNPPIAWDVRGRANYKCSDYPDKSCAEGQHLLCSQDIRCTYKANLYEATLNTRNLRRIPIPNYAYWLEIHRRNPLGDAPWHRPTLLILDEAHLAPELLTRFLSMRLYESAFKACTNRPCPVVADPDLWKQYAFDIMPDLMKYIKYLKDHITTNSVELLISAQELAERLVVLRTLGPDWVIEPKVGPRGGKLWEFCPVWVGRYAPRYLFCGARQVVLLSGSARPKTTYQLGINSMISKFREWPRVFPAYRSPVYHIKTVKLNKDSTDADMWAIVHRIDEIFESRSDRKGIIHTGSYRRQEFILKNSKYAEFMIANTQEPDSENAEDVVRKFKAEVPPMMLVTPSCGTGWDFPGEDAEWQVIVKVPYPDISSEVMRHRMKQDPTYLPYVTGQELIQMCGRITRFAEDRGETFILDGTIHKLEFQIMPKLNRKGWLVPNWFKIWHVDTIPPVGPSLYDERRKVKV